LPESMLMEDVDFLFENTSVRVIAVRSSPKLELVGLEVGPFEEGNEYSTKFWIAKQLVKAGIVRFPEEEMIDIAKLLRIQWTERIQSVSQVSSLPETFYPKLRYFLSEVKASSRNSMEKMREYERVKWLSQDIATCRLKKIISLASASDSADQILRNLTVEERTLYENLRRIISEWKSKILQ